MVRYSILSNDIKILTDDSFITEHLKNGIKLIFICDKNQAQDLRVAYEKYLIAGLLHLHINTGIAMPIITIEDGCFENVSKCDFDMLCKYTPTFNSEQYAIEHAPYDKDIIVKAGAGTGKTTVIIDRILFLLHIVPELKLSEIGMITFTNEATTNMKHKLQKVLLKRYRATGAIKYVKMLEEQSKVDIRTIHSFSREVIKELGAIVGYGNNPGLKSYKYEKSQLIYDVLNDFYKMNRGEVAEKLGLPLQDLEKIITYFWQHIDNLGMKDCELIEMDWGRPTDTASIKLQETLKKSLGVLVERYNELKLKKDAIAVGDIVRELQNIMAYGEKMSLKHMTLKYLFVDEFQDSDNAQIRSMTMLKDVLGLKLFVVGDVKQSIYRFRGAVETSFEQLIKNLNASEPLAVYSLIRNYRTHADVLNQLNDKFEIWDKLGLLNENDRLEPQVIGDGKINVHKLIGKSSVIYNELKNVLTETIADCIEYSRTNSLMERDEQKVTVLTRANFQLEYIRKLCEAENIPCYIRQEGSFYSSPAVLDFYAMVKAFLFYKNPKHLFEYIQSSYIPFEVDFQKLQSYDSGSDEQYNWLVGMLDYEQWDKYLKEFRFRPVLAVLRDIADNSSPEKIYAEYRAEQLDMSKENAERQKAIDMKQYSSNLEKLFHIIRGSFSGSMASLYNIYEFLRLKISTDKIEDEPDVSETVSCECVHGMTVHKAKGLEFDTVIIPFTDYDFLRQRQLTVVIDEAEYPHKCGWRYKELKSSNVYSNEYFSYCYEKECENIRREEARLLYVALTRTIRRLEYFDIECAGENTWSRMLRSR